jgi:MFS family permease
VPGSKPSIFTGVRFIAAQPLLKSLTLQMVLMSVFAVSFVPILPVFVREALNTGASAYGGLTSALGVGAASGAIIVGWLGRRVPRAKLANAGSMALAVTLVVFSRLESLTPALLCIGVAGAAMATNGISTATSLQLAAPAHLRGQVMAVYSFVVLGLAPFGAFQAGWLAEHFGSPIAILVSGAVALGGTLLLRPALWHTVED